MTLPTVVIESGFSESMAQLHRDRDLWLKGGQGCVQIVIIIKWTRHASKKAKGDVEVFNLDTNGDPQLL
jgi:hypothetical protein